MTDEEKDLVRRLAEASRAVCDAHDLGVVPLRKMLTLDIATRAWEDRMLREFLRSPEPESVPLPPGKPPRARRQKPPPPPPSRRLLEAPPSDDDEIEGEPTRSIRMTPHPMRVPASEKK
jgi:hypothetical protein